MIPDGYAETAMGVLALAIAFGYGLLEAAVFKRKDWACATWTPALLALTGWIAYPLTLDRLFIAGIVFVLGMTLIVTYYRQPGKQ
jgi:hypothetical protein